MNDLERFEEFEKRINRTMANMAVKISLLHDTTVQLKDSFSEFQKEIGELMRYIPEHITDHE